MRDARPLARSRGDAARSRAIPEPVKAHDAKLANGVPCHNRLLAVVTIGDREKRSKRAVTYRRSPDDLLAKSPWRNALMIVKPDTFVKFLTRAFSTRNDSTTSGARSAPG